MAFDSKYGRVELERGNIGENEPVVVFRAQDKLLTQVLNFYLGLCTRAGSPVAHLNKVETTRDEIIEWQKEHFTKIPESKES